MTKETPENIFSNMMLAYNNLCKQTMEQSMNNNMLETDPLNLNDSFSKFYSDYFSDNTHFIQDQIQYVNDYLKILQNVNQKMSDKTTAPIFTPEGKDRRFADEAWDHYPWFNFLKQFYLMNNSWFEKILENDKNLDAKEKEKVKFFGKQFLNAMAPTNFPWSNPIVIKETLASGGQNIAKGMEHFLADMANKRISTTDFNAFEIGKNVAATPGKVIYQNRMMQLIQYTPIAPKTFKIPLLIMPAWINKYYILDLQAQHSFVRWLVEQGYTVFMISWVNPDSSYADVTFEDYLKEGPLTALDVVKQVTNEEDVNFMGYCLGGTLLAATIAYLTSAKKSHVRSATFLTTLIDFKECGDIGIFIDEKQIQHIEKMMEEKGYFDADAMAQTFSLLRSNDMIWSFYINNYLLGKEPFAFDILYWNADSTRLPAKMHSYYLRNMYLNNNLVKPNKIKLLGHGIDLKNIKIPTYVLSTKEDHIAPWRSTFEATRYYKNCRFVVSGSGHVAGVVNHPDRQKYQYWTNNKIEPDPDTWLKDAVETPGSWWIDWHKWQMQFAGEMIENRKIGGSKFKPIEDAPGSYVKVRV